MSDLMKTVQIVHLVIVCRVRKLPYLSVSSIQLWWFSSLPIEITSEPNGGKNVKHFQKSEIFFLFLSGSVRTLIISSLDLELKRV